MSEIEGGGFAFPGFNYVSSNVHDGMTLRDYFAAKAIATVWHDVPEDINREQALIYLGNRCYAMADAMIAARGAA